MKKRILGLLLAIVMILSPLPTKEQEAFASNEDVIASNEDVTVTYNVASEKYVVSTQHTNGYLFWYTHYTSVEETLTTSSDLYNNGHFDDYFIVTLDYSRQGRESG